MVLSKKLVRVAVAVLAVAAAAALLAVRGSHAGDAASPSTAARPPAATPTPAAAPEAASFPTEEAGEILDAEDALDLPDDALAGRAVDGEGSPAPRADVYLYPARLDVQGPNPCPDADLSGDALLDGDCDAAVRDVVRRIDADAPPLTPLAHAVAGDAGEFRFRVDPSRTFVVVAEHEGRRGAADEARGGESILVVLEDSGEVSGAIEDDRGRPLARAEVVAVSDPTFRIRSTRTGADGRFAFSAVPDAPTHLLARAPGYRPELDRAYAGPDNVVTLSVAAPVRGLVLAGGRAASGADVEFAGTGLSTRTGSDGRFEFADASCDPCHVEVRWRDLVALARVPDAVGAERIREIAVELAAPASLTVRVDLAGAAGSGATAVVLNADLRDPAPRHADPRGGETYAITLPAGEWVLDVSRPGFVRDTRPLALAAGEPATVGVRLQRSAAIEGRVLDAEGEPIAQACVVARPVAGRDSASDGVARSEAPDIVCTGSEGAFRIEGLAPGPYQLEVVERDHERAVRTAVAPASGLRLVLAVAGTIAGRVAAADGANLAGVLRIDVVRPEDPDAAKSPRSHRRHRIRSFDHVDPEPPVSVDGPAFVARVPAPGFWDVRVAADGYLPQSRVVAVRSGGRVEIDFRLEQGLAVAGVIVDDLGRPVEGARVRIHQEGLDRVLDVANTDAQGRFELSGLVSGPGLLFATREGHAGADQAVTVVASAAVRVVLVREARVRGRVVGADGQPVQVFEVNGAAVASPAGEFLETAPPAIPWTVRLTGAFVPVERTIEVAPGGEADLGAIRVASGATVSGRVRCADGAVPEACRVDAHAAEDDGTVRPFVRWAPVESGGRYVIRHLPAAAVAVQVVCRAGYARQTIDLSAGDGKLDLVVETGATLSVAAPWAEPGAAVHALHPDVQFSEELDPARRASLVGLPAGRYVVIVAAQVGRGAATVLLGAGERREVVVDRGPDDDEGDRGP